ncbi:autotransporter outer membrane beta-barrel domain-containing protein, partial [Campylobacter jejuni]|uniref:autotransporter outer membrane beta-barrel domain-containing protein n=1 Tax=Campylobacter jejuni TaxID=197 RepID=UPI000873DF98
MKNITLTKTPIGEGKEPCLNSKKIVLSLATISFLASCANATLAPEIKTYDEANKNTKARSASVYQNTNTTVSGSETSTINISDQGPHTIIIQSGGTLGSIGNTGNIIYASTNNGNTLTLANLTNNGTINGKVAIQNSQDNLTGTITVNTFENIGQVNGQIYMGVWGNKNSGILTVDQFDNSGTIASSDKGVFFEGGANNKSTINNFNNTGVITTSTNKEAVRFNHTDVKTITNNGNIKSEGHRGISIDNSSVQTLNNSGTIQTSNQDVNNWDTQAIYIGYSTIQTFINSGTLKGDGRKDPGGPNGAMFASSGVNLSGSTITNFDNSGILSGRVGINISSTTIDNFKNTGTIEGTSGAKQLSGAVFIQSWRTSSSTIKNFENTGLIKNQNGNAIFIGDGNKIETLTNKGTIEAGNNGITFYAFDTNKKPVNIGKITIEEGGVIKAGNDAIHIDGSKNGIEGEGIEVKEGGRLEGGNAGIYIGGGKQVNTSINVSGTIQGGNGGIINTGTIGQKDAEVQTHGITIENEGLIASAKGSGILNTDNGIIYGNIFNKSNNNLSLKNDSDATITSGIKNEGGGTIFVNNQGTIDKDNSGNHLVNSGSGSIVIEDWLVTTDKDTGKLDTIIVGGNGNVSADKITIDEGNLDLGQLDNINNIISGVKPGNIGNIGTNGSGEISLSFDPITGKLTTDFNLNASISGATFRSLISTTSRRSTFIDNVMGNSMQSFALASSSKSQSIAMSEKGNLYADASDYIKSDLNNGSYGSNKEHSLFILPYTSSQNVELSLNEESKGHTKGTIIGYSTLKDSGIYGVYVGYEDTKMGSTYFDINNRTYYAGLKYFNTLFTTEKGQEVYIKAQGKAALIKNDLTKKIGNNEAKAEPNSYAYGVNTALGMNFISNKDIFSPEVGLAYEGGYTEAFSMKDTIGQATVQGGERTYTNYLNLFSTKTSFTWFRDWLPNLKTSVELGAKFNVNPKTQAKARFGDIKVSDEFYLPRVQKFVSTSFIVPVNEAFYFSLNYN